MKNKIIAILFIACIIGGIWWYNEGRDNILYYNTTGTSQNTPLPLKENKWVTILKVDNTEEVISVVVKEKYGGEKTFYGTYVMESPSEYLIGRNWSEVIKIEKSNVFSLTSKIIKRSSVENLE